MFNSPFYYYIENTIIYILNPIYKMLIQMTDIDPTKRGSLDGHINTLKDVISHM